LLLTQQLLLHLSLAHLHTTRPASILHAEAYKSEKMEMLKKAKLLATYSKIIFDYFI
jgi:hypothetical protein